MFDIRLVIKLSGRFDAAQAERAEAFLNEIKTSAIVDCEELTYLSSSAIGILFAAQKRLMGLGAGLKLVHLNSHLREMFRIAGFDTVFDIE